MLGFFRTFGRNDLRVISRDSFMFWAASLPLVVWIPIRFLVPLCTEWLARARGFDLTPYYSLIVIMFPIMTICILLGLLFGLLVLDERDNSTLSALQVTPLSMGAYARYRIGLPAAYGFVMTVANLPLLGILPAHMFWPGVLTALSCVFFGPILVMGLGTIARNKIEAITVFRGITLLIPINLVAFFIDSNWHYAFGINPVFWAMKGFWVYWDGGNGLGFLAIGLAYSFLATVLLFGPFKRRLGEVPLTAPGEEA